ncbi:hypothetical protein [Cohnella algarum]|uniref:hypothetical protein n=1 Tax=Cohnella algarum TaxID=2044859 RepID=UPI00196874CC|nr:hypothetical protein [Cohnella algarum]MBN2982683.1 hypothetical protein [Cohnella algarum]
MSELARRLAGELVRAGVRHAFGVAGSGISYDLIACLRSSAFRTIRPPTKRPPR